MRPLHVVFLELSVVFTNEFHATTYTKEHAWKVGLLRGVKKDSLRLISGVVQKHFNGWSQRFRVGWNTRRHLSTDQSLETGACRAVFEATIKHWGRFRETVCWVGLGDSRATVETDEEHLHSISQMPMLASYSVNLNIRGKQQSTLVREPT